MAITHNTHVHTSDSFTPPTFSLQEQRALLRTLRQQMVAHYRPNIFQGAGPIRVMANTLFVKKSYSLKL